MIIKRLYLPLLMVVLFSCKSTPPSNYPLGWDRNKFTQQDGRLFEAVKYGTVSDVSKALDGSPDINVSDYLGQTAFMWACKIGNLDIINALLNHDKKNRDTKKYKPLKINATSSPINPELNYNALFCYIMSQTIVPSNQKAQNTLDSIINVDKTILDMTDWYGETVIHKLVRSNNDYFDVITKYMDGPKKKDLLNRESIKYRQSPLMLAVELGNGWIIDAMINDGTVIDDITDKDIPVYAFNQGNGDIEIFTSLFIGKMKDDILNSRQREENRQFENAFAECSKGESTPGFKRKIFYFWEIYNNYRNPDITDPKDLEPREYLSRVNRIFDMLERKMTEKEKLEFFDELEGLPAALKKSKNVNDMNRTLLQMVIEYQDTDVFKSLLDRHVPLHRTPRPNNGTGDYLTIAMLKRKTDIMHILLNEYQNPASNIQSLMRPSTIIAGDIAADSFGRDDLTDPLLLFCTDRSLSSDTELLRKMAGFFESKYSIDNISYCTELLSELEKGKHFGVYGFYLDNYSPYFCKVEKLNGEPVIKALLDNDQKELVRKHFKGNRELDKENEQALRKDQVLWNEYSRLKTPPEPETEQRKGLQ